jgi:antitoxin component YwqK of YwqJK toxin-antitoxin module
MKFVLVACTLVSSIFCHEVEIVRDHLQPRAPEWRPSIVETYPNGSAKAVYFFEDSADGKEISVKRVVLREGGAISVEEDMEGDLQHGLSVSYYEDGRVKEITSYAKGVKHGPHKEFYPSGSLKSEELYDQGLIWGQKTSFFEDGQKEFECYINKGKIEGEAWTYYQSGKRKGMVPYRAGLKEGLAIEWHQNGVTSIKVNYVADKENDFGNNPALVAYDENGAIFSIRHFSYGVPVGVHVVYHPNGQESDKVGYKDGKMHGPAQAFSLDGELIGETTYKEGLRIGKSWLKYENGTFKFIAEFNDKGELLKPIQEFAENGQMTAVYSLTSSNELDGKFQRWSDQGVLLVDYFYQGGKFSGEQKEFYSNGNPYKVFSYKDGKLTGVGQEWHENGKLALKATYLEDRVDGEITQWYQNGQMKSKRTFIKGEPNGLHQSWYENGIEKESVNFQKGVMTGIHRQWNEEGELLLEESYDKGKVKGVVSTFYGKKRPKEIVEVAHGVRHGKTQEYYPNGQLKLKVSYQNDKPEGVAEGYYEDGSLAFSKFYKEGLFVGEQKEFFRKEQLKEAKEEHALSGVCFYNSKGNMQGEQKMYHPNGNLQSIVTYDDGVLHGRKALFSIQGEIIEEGFYEKGKLSGKFMQKDQSGKEIVCHYVKNRKEGPYEIFYPLHEKYGKVKALEATYKNGYIEGEVKEFNDVGVMVASSHFVKGKKEGEAFLYNMKGKLACKMSFANDKKSGPTIQYDPEGAIFKTTPYENDTISGEEITYYQNGSTSSIVTYKNGKLDGPSKSWNEEGTLVFEGDYKEGKKEGKFNKYFDNGKPKIIQIYKDDTLVSKETFK